MKFPVHVLPLVAMACSSATVVGVDGGNVGGGGETPDAATTDDAAIADGGGDGAQQSVKFADVYAIISSKCSNCHTANSQGGLKMETEDAAYAALVGVASVECAGRTRVIKGDPDNSIVVTTLKGIPTCTVPRMPKSRTPLSAAEIATFESWIKAGAER
jgi:hypothetical protein